MEKTQRSLLCTSHQNTVMHRGNFQSPRENTVKPRQHVNKNFESQISSGTKQRLLTFSLFLRAGKEAKQDDQGSGLGQNVFKTDVHTRTITSSLILYALSHLGCTSRLSIRRQRVCQPHPVPLFYLPQKYTSRHLK